MKPEVLDLEESPKMEEPKKKNNSPVIIIVVILLIGIGLFIGYKAGINKEEKTLEENPTKAIEEEVPKLEEYMGENEKIVTDKNIIAKIEKIDKRFDYRLATAYALDKETKDANAEGEMEENPEGRNKLNIYFILKYLFSTEYVKPATCDQLIDVMIDNCDQLEPEMYYIKGEDVNRIYEETFGKQPGELIIEGVIPNTNNLYTYTSSLIKLNNDLYKFKTKSDEVLHSSKIDRANIKYTEDNNYYYEYFFYSYTDGEYTYYGQKDHEKNVNSKDESRKNLKINNDNYKDFELIKVAFKKADSNIYFDRIEQVGR